MWATSIKRFLDSPYSPSQMAAQLADATLSEYITLSYTISLKNLPLPVGDLEPI